MNANHGYENPGIAGSGAIATGLAAVSTTTANTILLARSEASAWRAEEKAVAACAKIEGADPSRLRVTTDPADLTECDVVVESVIEELEPKGEVLATVAEAVDTAVPTTDPGYSTTSAPATLNHGDGFGASYYTGDFNGAATFSASTVFQPSTLAPARRPTTRCGRW